MRWLRWYCYVKRMLRKCQHCRVPQVLLMVEKAKLDTVRYKIYTPSFFTLYTVHMFICHRVFYTVYSRR